MTYSLSFFLGPGLPRTLATTSLPLAPAAPRLTPFFLTTSVGGPITACDDGVPGVESEAFSPLEAAVGRSAGVLTSGAGEPWTGDSATRDDGSMILRSFSGATCKVTSMVNLPLDLRPLS